MKHFNKKDKQRRNDFRRYESYRRQLKYIINNTSDYDLSFRTRAYNRLVKLKRDSSLTRKVNRCVLTGTAKGIIRSFRVSRMKFKSLINVGKISGVFLKT